MSHETDFVRHGQAQPYCQDDAGRNLTDFGRMQAAQTASHMTAAHHIDLIIASPYHRANQTAKIIQEQALTSGQSPLFLTVSSITPDDDPATALDDIDCAIRAKFDMDTEDKCIVVVCHMPIVAHLVAQLEGLSPTAFELAEYRVLKTSVLAADLAQTLSGFVPDQP